MRLSCLSIEQTERTHSNKILIVPLHILILLLLYSITSHAFVSVTPCLAKVAIMPDVSIMVFPLWQSSEISSLSVSDYLPMQRSTETRSIPNYNLSETKAFKMLKREPVYYGAVKELKDLQDFEDSRLASCEESGIFWDQCFMYGKINDGNGGGKTNQLAPPTGSLTNPPYDKKMIPTW